MFFCRFTILMWSITSIDIFFSGKGGGSASDSGRSIASSVSTEPFFSSQSAPTEPQQATDTAQRSQSESQTASDATTIANNNEQATSNAVAEASTSQIPDAQPDDTNESQDTNESKEPETAANNDNADIVINVYSSGDEGTLNHECWMRRQGMRY